MPTFEVTSRRPSSPVEYHGALDEDEIWWRDHQSWLQDQGYLLRPRYKPDWIPSWTKTGNHYFSCEDGQTVLHGNILDATRLFDGAAVVIKKIITRRHPHEVEISLYFSKEPLASDPKNHCVPVYDVLAPPDDDTLKLLVMPLVREFDSPRFLTVGEAIECFRQLIEGVRFMHSHHVAHRDIGMLNFMMDPHPLFPHLYHFVSINENKQLTGPAKHYTRTGRPTKYYLIDFGLSRKYDPTAGPPREWPIWGGDKTVPEFHKSDEPCDPFPTDIYYLGNLISTRMLQEYRGLEFMQPLIDHMVKEEPSDRPTIDQVSARFDLLLGSLSTWRLRSRLPPRNELWLIGCFRAIAHAFRTLYHVFTVRPALPRP